MTLFWLLKVITANVIFSGIFLQELQEEFVRVRKENPAAMSVNDFHRLLSLVR